MKQNYTLSLLVLMAASVFTLSAQDIAVGHSYQELPLHLQVLDDMPTPRLGHVSFATGEGDVVVVGGHTTGFALTSTAELLHDGHWKSLSINSPHDGASVTVLPDGRALVTGGFSSALGVGQSAVAHVYNPTTQTFAVTGALDAERAYTHGVLTGIDSNVLISGNWYSGDASLELWNGASFIAFGSKDRPITSPHMVSDGRGTVYVFGTSNNYGVHNDVAAYKVDTRAQTVEAFAMPELEGYILPENIFGHDLKLSVTADGRYLFLAKKNDVEYDLFAFNPQTGQASFVVSLSRTMANSGQSVDLRSSVLVNTARGEAYVLGVMPDDSQKPLVLVNYNLQTGDLIYYYGGSFEGYLTSGSWTLQPTTGHLIVTGGSVSSNFDAVATTISIKPFEGDSGIATAQAGEAHVVARFGLDGRKIDAPTRGINILLMSDGSARKVLVK